MKYIKLRKGMSKESVNNLVGYLVQLEDEVYQGNKYKHHWKCKCGNIFTRTFSNMKATNTNCGCEKYLEQESRYKKEVEKDGEYEYIRSYRKGEMTPDGKSPNSQPYLLIKHKYCGNLYTITASSFINEKKRCGKCCQKYENSFAYYIEKELNLKLEDVWDFEKNKENPYLISKSRNEKHKSDDKDLKVWIKCQEKDYHGSYLISCNSFIYSYSNYGKFGCCYCSPTGNNPSVHLYDSFGYNNFDYVQSWSLNNKISPFKITSNNAREFEFICPYCGGVFKRKISTVKRSGVRCRKCVVSSGETKILNHLDKNNINYIHDQPYFNDLIGIGNNPLRPDFILPDYKIWIEYDGEFHYKKMYDDNSFEILKNHDKRKNEYAEKHGWKMIRIPYWEFDNIENILEKELIFKIKS